MVVKLNLNCSTWLRSQACTVEGTLRHIQRELANTLDYDICLSLLFNDSRNVAIVKGTYIRDDILPASEIPETVFINKSTYTALKNLIDRKDIIEVYDAGLHPTLIEGMESEIYIPIFEPIDLKDCSLRLIGVLYLGSASAKYFPKDVFNEDKICNLISGISKLYKIIADELTSTIKAINVISVFVEILEQKERYLPNHSFNVANWCREIGMVLGYNKRDLIKLTYAGLLHDIGKCLIDCKILNKPGKLTEEEYAVVKEHSLISQRIVQNILKDIPLLKDIPRIIKYHHERYDGKGYPCGLKGDEVPFDSYIIGIADAVDAMFSERPYKKAMSLNEVINQLHKNKWKQFHPELVDIMIERLTRAQNQLEVNLIQPMELSSLILNLKEDLLVIEGTLMRIDNLYIFKPSDEALVENINLADITSAELAIKDINNINYYYIRIEDLLNNEFYISSLKLVPSANTFSLLWNLDGILYDPEDNKPIPIEITKVGGDSLAFYLTGDNKIEDSLFNKPLKIKILFDDMDIDITGNIVKSHNFGSYKYYNLHYTNIPDQKRDSIYRQLFRKQIELRKSVAQLR